MIEAPKKKIVADTVIGHRYRICRRIGGGAMKDVYLAEDLRLARRHCALAEMIDSFINPTLRADAVKSFIREADILAELDHPHVPKIYDRFNENNHHFLVMEFVEGENLEKRLSAAPKGRLADDEVNGIAVQILSTLKYLHSRQPPVVYRDLKPSNLMITPQGLVKLIDFGIARHFQPRVHVTTIGTPGYAPPEQYKGKAEPRSDLYALAALMHHALTGRDPTSEPPFSFPPLELLRPDLDPRIVSVINSALSYDLEKRPSDADSFRKMLLKGRTNEALASPTVVLGNSSKQNRVHDNSSETGAPLDASHTQVRLMCSCGARPYSENSLWCTKCGRKLTQR